jgi:hypothetical protein
MTVVLASLLTGLFTLAAGLSTLFLQGRQQRVAAQDERLWTRRAETYVALLQYQGLGVVEGYSGARSAQEWAVVGELTAKASAFASEEVHELWQQSARANLALDAYVEEEHPDCLVAVGEERLRIEEKMEEEDPEFRRVRQVSDDAGKQLAERIRAELDVVRQGSLRGFTGRRR